MFVAKPFSAIGVELDCRYDALGLHLLSAHDLIPCAKHTRWNMDLDRLRVHFDLKPNAESLIRLALRRRQELLSRVAAIDAEILELRKKMEESTMASSSVSRSMSPL